MVSVFAPCRSNHIAHYRISIIHLSPVNVICFLLVSICEEIGDVRDVEIILPASPKGRVKIQWKAPDVLSGSSSPLYYNITMRNSSKQIIAQNTSTNASIALHTDLLVPCHSYELTVLPFQQISSHNELGIMVQTTKNYSGSKLASAFE